VTDDHAVTPVFPTTAMIDNDDGTVSEAIEAMVQDNNDVVMDHSDLGILTS
jgi:hypothetical protein